MKNTAALSSLCAVLALLILGPIYSQQRVFPGTAQAGDMFAHATPSVPSDRYAGSCNVPNTSPYAGMNPLVCKGVANPVDSRGQCSLAGLRLLRVVGSMCYYCQSINPSINGIVIPRDQIQQAAQQGFKCGVDQANPDCMAVCTGGGAYNPPNKQPTPSLADSASTQGGCVPPQNWSPAARAQWYQTYILTGRIRCSGGYNPCDNPDPPSWCPARALPEQRPEPQPTQTCLPRAGQGAFPPAGGAGVGPQVVINMVELWKRRVDTYWLQEFRSEDLIYRPPMLIQAPPDLEYDPNTFTIEYDPAFMQNVVAATGNFGLVVALAHEEGHNVQMVRGRYMTFSPAMLRENNADRLAGSFLRWAEQNGFLHECDLGAAAMATFRVGDTLPAFNPLAHGSPAERVHFLLQGYLHGPGSF